MRISPDSSLRRFVQAVKMIRSVRPGHFSPWRSIFVPAPPPLSDLPPEEIQRANEASRRYFERESLRAFWLEKPFSEAATAPRALHRFGLLADALQIRPGDRILDFGCGSGWTSVFLARLGAFCGPRAFFARQRAFFRPEGAGEGRNVRCFSRLEQKDSHGTDS